ncbi:outer membrane protein assembly factor BamB family protein [Cellulomonas sp. URHB0016]
MVRTYVELVEDDGAVRPEDGPPPRLVDSARRHPVRAAVAAGAVLVVVVAGLVGQAVVDAGERARLARLAHVPGVLRPVDLPLHTLVSAEGDVAGAMQSGILVGGTLVAGSYRPVLSDPDVVAVDRTTGAPVWRVSVELPPPPVPAPDLRTQDDVTSAVWCTTAAHPPQGAHPRVACVVSWSYGWEVEADGSGYEVAVRGLVVLDATDGAVVARRDEPLGSDIYTAEDQYWVTTVDDDRAGVTAVARSYDGEDRWTTHVAVPGSVPVGSTPYVLHDERRTVLAVGTRAWLLGEDGAVLHALGSGSGSGGVALVPGGVLVQRFDGTGGGRLDGAVVWHDDGTTVDVRGDDLVRFSVDDGSRPDRVFTVAESTGDLVGRDKSGAEAWRAHVGVGSSTLLLDGTIVAAAAGELVAVDADDGGVRWRTTMPMPVDELLTDGRLALGVNGRTVRAYGIDDGVLRWTARLDVGEDGAPVLERRVTDEPTTADGAPTSGLDDGWWTVTRDGHLAYSDPTGASRLVVLR